MLILTPTTKPFLFTSRGKYALKEHSQIVKHLTATPRDWEIERQPCVDRHHVWAHRKRRHSFLQPALRRLSFDNASSILAILNHLGPVEGWGKCLGPSSSSRSNTGSHRSYWRVIMTTVFNPVHYVCSSTTANQTLGNRDTTDIRTQFFRDTA